MRSRQHNTNSPYLVRRNFALDACRLDAVGYRFVTFRYSFGKLYKFPIEMRSCGVNVRRYHPAFNVVGHPGIGCAFCFLEIKELKQENQQLRDEVVARDESIERLQIMMQKQREQYSRELVKVQGKHIKELDETRKEISRLSQMIKKACAWLPLLKELFRMERLCRVVGFSTEQTAKLMLGEKIEHNGTLYSEEYKRNFVTDKVTAQIVTASTVGKNKLVLIINRKNVSDWFREQFSKLYQRIQPKEEQKRSKGFSL